ncbi:MAG: lasso RiPP family leader peptide-containing protein [Proteobacteria bacterium]|nr:lasso RiPP family leader peptide-containing protein [Pseudomonadota bacterium]MBU1139083.1 lasso RiPP family leader peptide-containing protein [Pseudomonadota bacterium]MBU1232799.1 lasso RiPP family leader peptide-containing protein [Pseudomonadota bacterium]MBU1420031.1 lasso RiPP family leader peptide-containing protein [Pseudomonadota bacterium]MBU1454726.1 lasso RiPP family leader peptide-containing protein [Pseudomonadota bacterium]
MKKNEYVTPKIVEHGDVKKITQAGGTMADAMDNEWTTTNSDGSVTYHATFGS